MRKSLTYKILAAVMALTAVNYALPVNTMAGYFDNDKNYYVESDGEIISSGTFTNVYGNGYSFTINGGTINGRVFGVGNENYTEDVSGGNVTINGNAYIAGAVYGGRSGKGEAYNNTVNISGGSVVGSIGAVYGGRSTDGSAHHNTVNISDGSVTSAVSGGNSSRSAYNNIVNINGGNVTGEVRGGDSLSGQAHHNIVNISGGSVTGKVYGGASDSVQAHHNIVNISGGSVSGDVYGGWSADGSANGNKVIISGSADIENANLYGRNDSASGTGNTLTIDGWSGSTQSVKNFNDIAFKNINWNENKPVLTITVGSADDLENTNIKTIHIAGGSNINVGESMTLIKSENNTNLGLTEGNVTDTFTAGVAREGLGSTSIDGNGNVTFKVNSIKTA